MHPSALFNIVQKQYEAAVEFEERSIILNGDIRVYLNTAEIDPDQGIF